MRRINPRRGFPQLWESLFRLDMRPLLAYRQAGSKIVFMFFKHPAEVCFYDELLYPINLYP
ncbi:MAG: hypothetical protein A2042_01800 [Candidatus Schekmanbacteria bacterium GWA2_38_11]|uniref:Uncharacterized protein n=1 Tax=Candidatus Schekmanbacteria bacterium GWA2_38_11 TaxID=1817876 RepID=A0A1F7RMQ4_9BACT|nr:MAG: hypothetical protein A2042_01800 [Candidatus Schekmanbacteria bacterium GWA2_38_11]